MATMMLHTVGPMELSPTVMAVAGAVFVTGMGIVVYSWIRYLREQRQGPRRPQ